MLRVHEYQIDRATGMASLGRVNPLRRYVSVDHPPINVQDCYGDVKFFDDGGNQMDTSDVPAQVLEDLRQNPLRRGVESVEQVLRHCDLCGAPVASKEYEAHLIAHARGASGVEGEAPAPKKRPKES